MNTTQKPVTVAQIRQTFLEFFSSRGHTEVASSPLVPLNDPTLMFTNSGMVQFKDVFLGTDKRPYQRAVSVQRCLRAGGKHNDLENVGYTARHHTFFEMLGNWSFGDYFKKEAIQWSWELLTAVWQLPPERLLATVYHDDEEAYRTWTEVIGLPPERVIRIGDNQGGKYKSDNFWMMADTGPCGPCSEIFYDHGPDIPGGPPGSPDEDGDRFIEIWNLVFMQYDMDEQGSVTPLPAPCVDTGMGLERIAAVLQHVHSNYEIDLFQALIADAARVTACGDPNSPSLKVISDHLRAAAFLVVDGVIPGNEGRGYVQRRIIRRAIRHGYKLGCRKPFLHRLVRELVVQMGAAYPRLAEQEQHVTEVLRAEEERFFETLAHGMEILEIELEPMVRALRQFAVTRGLTKLEVSRPSGEGQQKQLSGSATKSSGEGVSILMGSPRDMDEKLVGAPGELLRVAYAPNLRVKEATRREDGLWFIGPSSVLCGESAFKLHDTYGFPLDLTQDVCREKGVRVDVAGFDAAMKQQREMARSAGHFQMERALDYEGADSKFVGYEHLAADAMVVTLYVGDESVPVLEAGQDGVVVLDVTPFYAEAGGQVGDRGLISAEEGGLRFEVRDTQKIKAHVYGHHGRLVNGHLRVGDPVRAQVDGALRAATMRNHSVTHLMHKALREVLGDHVQQKGSLVDEARTRFDFAHNAPVTPEQIVEVERRVNAEILANTATQARVMPIEEAKASGAMMLFGEKYGERVRVLDIGSSREFCGGTHVARTGDIGLFKIVSESGVAAGIRRVEAITGMGALAYLQETESAVRAAAHALHAAPQELVQRIDAVQAQLRAQEKAMDTLKGRLASSRGDELVEQAVEVNGIRVLAASLPGADARALRETMDRLKDKLGAAAIVLASVNGDRVQLAAGVTRAESRQIKAGELVNFVAAQVGGRGGGKPDLAMAGGSNPQALPAALASVQQWVSERT